MGVASEQVTSQGCKKPAPILAQVNERGKNCPWEFSEGCWESSQGQAERVLCPATPAVPAALVVGVDWGEWAEGGEEIGRRVPPAPSMLGLLGLKKRDLVATGALACDPSSTHKAGGSLKARGQPGLHSETLTQNQKEK